MANHIKFTGITREIYNSLTAKLATAGLELQGDSGKLSKSGVSAEYLYNPTNESLQINNVKVGFPASLGGYTPEKVIDQIKQQVTASGGKTSELLA